MKDFHQKKAMLLKLLFTKRIKKLAFQDKECVEYLETMKSIAEKGSRR